jgi:acetyl esterase
MKPDLRTDGPVSVHPSRTVLYKQTGSTELRLHIFEPPEATGRTDRPAIVFFFGGGWNTGQPGQFFPQCQALASRGLVSCSAEYRTHTSHGVSPRECVKDARSCLRWIRAHAGELGIDANRIAAGGGSAGGHLAASTALVESFDGPGEDFSVSCRPDALVLFNPVLDNGPDGYGYERVRADFPRISPAHNVNAGWPPTLIMVGTQDKLVPVSTMERFRDEMFRNRNLCILHLHAGAGHGFFNFDHPDNSAYFETLRQTEEFLKERGFVPGSESDSTRAVDAETRRKSGAATTRTTR